MGQALVVCLEASKEIKMVAPVKVESVELPPLQSSKQITVFVWLARVCGFFAGLLAFFSVSDLFNDIATKVFTLAVACCGWAAMWFMGQVPSAKQRASTESVNYTNNK
jgi:hypothetical protein